MKKLFTLSIFIMLLTFATYAQSPEIRFETTVYDFGLIQEENGLVTAIFEFTNDGDTPLIVNGVSASCGCTITEWTSEPVASKGKGFVKVSYNPKRRPGTFTKSITVKSNSSNQSVVLRVKGEVIRTQS